MRVSIQTLGCKQNYAESSHIRRQFEERGDRVVSLDDMADIVVINTCTVTENADSECRKIIRRARRSSPQARIVVTGCYAQLQPERLAAIEGVSAVVGAAEKFNIPHLLDDVHGCEAGKQFVSDLESVDFVESVFAENDGHTRAFLKIQDGCDYPCTYCTIPLARGANRAMSVERLIEHLHRLEREGFQEVVLTGINLGEYRSDDGSTLYDALLSVVKQDLDVRIRLSSLEVNKISHELIDLIADSAVMCKHFHVPLQSGSDRILSAMKRRYNTDRYAAVIARIRSRMPQAAIGADVICGFPGETDEDARQTLEFIRASGLHYLHVFRYSERAGTPAPHLAAPVPLRIRKQRVQELRELSDELRVRFYRTQVGREVDVICEGFDEHTMTSNGLSDTYIRAYYPSTSGLRGGSARVRLTAPLADGMQAELLYHNEPTRIPSFIPLPVCP